MITPVFPTSYFPPVFYLEQLLKYDAVLIEGHEHFSKQTYRNRCCILNANGVQTLSVPLKQTHQKIKTSQVNISFNQNWKLNHWRSIESAYNRSAYFEFYRDELSSLFYAHETNLLEFNTKILKWILSQLKTKIAIKYTTAYAGDAIFNLDSKYAANFTVNDDTFVKKYPQVFSYKNNFNAGLSCIDLLFNCGPDSINFLR